MPPFWRSLLSGSSSSKDKDSNNNNTASTSTATTASSNPSASGSSPSKSSNKSRQGSSASNSSLPTSSSSSIIPITHQGGSTTATTTTTTASSTRQQKTSRNSVPTAADGQIPSTHPITIPNARDNQQQQQQQQPSSSIAGTSIASGVLSTSSVTGDGLTDNDGDAANNTDDASSIPETPYASGHSPSHARHKFPQTTTATTTTTTNSASTTGTSSISSGAHADGPPRRSSTNSSGASLSNDDPTKLSGNGIDSDNNSSPSANSTTPALSRTASQQPPPDIPTTQTILANPLAQPSSGLAAAISSVLPSSSSSSSNNIITPNAVSPLVNNGKAISAAAPINESTSTGPRTFDIDDMITRLLDVGYGGKITKSVCLKNSEITALCLAAREVFLSQPTLLELAAPVKVIGDIHGQYHDLIRLFEMSGYPPAANYLFLGDYVDRGKQSLETILLLLCYKVKYPENFFMLRGNHECANVTRVYGFYDECKRRCNIKIWKTFVDVFNCLPIAAIVGGKIFCVHGGLSPSLSTMDDIRRISRPTDVPDYGLLNDLLWSDPSDTALDWEDNERGVSYCFGKAVINDFLAKYDFDLICRAHMVVEDGYEFWNERTLVTIFSAPNYCGEFDNYGAGLSCSSDLLCTFELLRPLEGPALRKELSKAQKNRLARAKA